MIVRRKHYKSIPKNLRRDFTKKQINIVLRKFRARFQFNKVYKKRHELFAMGVIEDNMHLPENHLYWRFCSGQFIDNDRDKGLSYVECVYGDYKYQKRYGFDYATATPKQKKKQSKKWFKRNTMWNDNFRIGILLNGGFNIITKIINVDENGEDGNGYDQFRNQTHQGEASCVLKNKVTGDINFRYSYTLPLIKLHPLRLFGYKYQNIMRGAGDGQYIYKFRIWRKLKTKQK